MAQAKVEWMTDTSRPHGPTTFFFADPATDHLFAMVLSLGAEIAALREELNLCRGALDQKGLLSAADVSAYRPSPADELESERRLRQMVNNLLFSLQRSAEPSSGLSEQRR